MDAATLRRAMQPSYIDDSSWEQDADAFNAALVAAECTTVRRAAAFCSQVGHESAGLRLFREQEWNDAWSWDRKAYLGRGAIQLTWQSNYRAFGQWCRANGHVSDSELFVNEPALLEQPRWAFLSASWYWLNGGPFAGRLNEFADAGNILMVSRGVNGNVTTPNGMPDRTDRWNNCLALGEALLPTEEISMAAVDDIKGFIKVFLGPVISDVKDIREQLTGSRDLVYVDDGKGNRVIDWKASFKGWAQLGKNPDGSNKTVVDSLADARERIIKLEARLDALEEKK